MRREEEDEEGEVASDKSQRIPSSEFMSQIQRKSGVKWFQVSYSHDFSLQNGNLSTKLSSASLLRFFFVIFYHLFRQSNR